MKKNDSVEVSVVVPCYNSEKYLNKALDIICNQSYNDYEVICVDDGSTDGTESILKQYCKKYSFFRYVKKKNDKAKTTISTGLRETRGKYVCVVDNDDLITYNYLEILHKRIVETDADISICGYQRQDVDTGKILSTEMNKRCDLLVLDDDYGDLLSINTSLWNKMIKRELIIPYLDEEGLFSMDMLFMAYVYAKARKIAFTDKVLYYYQVSKQSSINNMKMSYLEDIQKALLIIKDYYMKVNKGMYDFLCTYVFLHIGVSLTFRFYNSTHFNDAYMSNKKYLKDNFNRWRKSKYLSFVYVIKNHFKNLKLFVCSIFYKIHMFRFFLFMYNFVINKLKFEIKW